MKIVAVIPAFNEEKRLGAALLSASPHVDEIVVVDDCSQDKTGCVARHFGAHVLTHLVNRGQGAALQTGMDYAQQKLKADIVVHFDADGQMRGDEIPGMVDPIQKGEADVVLGSRYLGVAESMPLFRKIFMRVATLFTRIVSGVSVTDTHNGFRALSAFAIERIEFSLDRMAHASEIYELISAHDLTYVERPVTIRYTDETLEKGQSLTGAFSIVKDLIRHTFFG
ncbi:MAG: glycosyltransferase family 2 protein [bacterium]|nr:glycosyltransferase family 2 protein [bacterium]